MLFFHFSGTRARSDAHITRQLNTFARTKLEDRINDESP